MLKRILSHLSRDDAEDPSNAAIRLIAEQNTRALRRIKEFQSAYSKGAATLDEFSHLKHQFPFFGFVPCRAGEIDFTMFHANDDIVAWEYLWFGPDSYEKEIVATWLGWCKGAAVVYDIGAYTGLMSLLAAKVSPKAHIHLFEPMDRTIERAKINIKANYLDGRIKLHNKAASDSNKEVSINLYREENFLGTGNSVFDKGLKIHDVKKVQSVTVDSQLPNSNPDVVKIDVEGHEMACIEGMQKTIERARPKMIVEVWEHDRNDVLSMLTELGYECIPFEKNERRVMNFRCLPRR